MSTGIERDRVWREVFRTVPRSRAAWLLMAALGGTLAVHGAMWGVGRLIEPSLETWSAQLAARAHTELARESEIDLLPPPKVQAPPPPPPVAEKETPKDEPEPPPTRVAMKEPARSTPPAGPAEAARTVVREDGPVDLGDFSMIQGQGKVFAGGISRADGSSKTAVDKLPEATPPIEAVQPKPTVEVPTPRKVTPTPTPVEPEEDRSEPVRLVNPDWNCPWPHEADDEQIDEHSAIVRVTIGPDSAVVGARIVTDPGHGFGKAALACAKGTSYHAARDKRGTPVRAESPPIRVRFTR